MVSFAYAAARSEFVERETLVVRRTQGAMPRPANAVSSGGFEATRRLVLAMIAVATLGLIGWAAARVMDSPLLGFVFADLVFLVGIALRGAVVPQRRSRTY